MIRVHLRIFLFIFAFQVDVHVRAEELNSNLVFSTKNCWQEDARCAVKSKVNGAQLELDSLSEFFLKQNTIVIKNSAKELYLAEGAIFLKAKSNLKISMAYGDFNLKKNDEVFLQIEDKKALLRVMSGEVVFVTHYSKTKYPIVAGFENWFGGLSASYVEQIGILKPYDFLPQVKDWAKLTQAGEEQVKEKIKLWLPANKAAATEVADFNAQVISREIASQQKQLRKEELILKRTKDEEARLRRLFRQKNFIDQ